MTRPVTASEIDTVWHWVEPLVERYRRRCSGWPADEVLARLKSKHWQLWVAEGVFAITGIWPPECHIIMCAGKMPRQDALKPIEGWAVAEGCRVVKLDGRKGWARVFPDYSWNDGMLEKAIG